MAQQTKCNHKWELDFVENYTRFCNGDNCDAKNGEHDCGSFQEAHYKCTFCEAEASETELESGGFNWRDAS